MTRQARLAALVVLTLALAAGFTFVPPVPQWPEYHGFADRRACLGLPNCLDTASNVLFVLAGAWGLHVLLGTTLRPVFLDARERLPYALFFLAVVLIGLASAYYHLAPDNTRLAWDRAAMALAFMAWFAALFAERVGVKAGLMLLAPLCAAGLGAVFYWSWSETQGAGDLRPWLLIQLMLILLVPLLLWLYPPRYSRGHDMLAVVGLYLVALLLDLGDRTVFALTDGLVGGHALKHLVAALAAGFIARHLCHRRRA
ncbi:MAG: hypothetical protein ABS56_01735 [Lautropia sp. SCN 69-89]|mgnify:CR=1 FL=1|nr:MAG: hypothetical protein ABS56_01735 [Lautropia sp. SCN 69-89]